jgi:hypothetical protein
VTVYDDTPLPHVRVLWQPEQYNRINNPGFEATTGSWQIGAGINAAGSSITRITTDFQTGTACGELVTTATDMSGVHVDLSPDIYFAHATYGTAYVALVYLKQVSGAARARLILGSAGSADQAEQDIVLRDKWTPYRVVWQPTANRTDVQLAITNGYAAALTVRIDNVRVYTLDSFSQLENGNFRADTTGWDIGGAAIAAAPTSLTRVAVSMDASDPHSATLVTTAVSGSGAGYSLGNSLFSQFRTYRLRVAACTVSGVANMRLRFGSLGTPADRADATFALTTAWQIFELDWSPSANRRDACAAISNASAAVVTMRFGLVEVFDTLDVVDSPYLATMTWTQGQQGQSPRMPPGTFQVTLNDSGRRFFPQNAASPLAGLLKAGRRIWARATYANVIYPLFYGTVRRIVPDGDALVTELSGQDPLFDIGQLDFSIGFLENESYRDMRRIALQQSVPGSRLNLTTLGLESSYFFGGNESQSALSVLEAYNEATGTLHWVQPHAQAEVLWQYSTIERATLTDATISAETFNDDFADLSGVLASDEALENHQYVPWQSYERDSAPDDDGTGFGYVVSAVDPSVWPHDLEDPYLHYLNPAFGTDDNIPEMTIERITRWTKKGRKKVRKVRIYPGAFVPFSMAAGESPQFVFDFSVPMSGTSLSVNAAAQALMIITEIESYPRHLVLELFATAGLTVTFFALAATPWLPGDEMTAEQLDYAGIVDAGDRSGPSIQTPYIGSPGMAEGIGNHRNWRYAGSLPQPTVRVEQRFPSSLQRRIGDHVTLVAARWGISSQPAIITGLQGEMNSGARSWALNYNLEATPAGAPWIELDSGAMLNTSALLAY